VSVDCGGVLLEQQARASRSVVDTSLQHRHAIRVVQRVCHAGKLQRTVEDQKRETVTKSSMAFVSDKIV
jgi:hypothetical protein